VVNFTNHFEFGGHFWACGAPCFIALGNTRLEHILRSTQMTEGTRVERWGKKTFLGEKLRSPPCGTWGKQALDFSHRGGVDVLEKVGLSLCKR